MVCKTSSLVVFSALFLILGVFYQLYFAPSSETSTAIKDHSLSVVDLFSAVFFSIFGFRFNGFKEEDDSKTAVSQASILIHTEDETSKIASSHGLVEDIMSTVTKNAATLTDEDIPLETPDESSAENKAEPPTSTSTYQETSSQFDEDSASIKSLFANHPSLKRRSNKWKTKTLQQIRDLSGPKLWKLVKKPPTEFELILAVDLSLASLSMDLIDDDRPLEESEDESHIEEDNTDNADIQTDDAQVDENEKDNEKNREKRKHRLWKTPVKSSDSFFKIENIVRKSSDIFEAQAPDLSTDLTEFSPFLTRVLFPEHTKIIVFGDVHGSIISFLTTLQTLTMSPASDFFRKYGGHNGANKNDDKDHSKDAKPCMTENLIVASHCRLVFLGDFVDRGMKSIEVIYVMSLLRILNGDKVMIVRGNHEDLKMCVHYGLGSEIVHKYPTTKYHVLARLIRWFQFFPYALYAGTLNHETKQTNFIQFSHGIAEIGFSPEEFLATPGGSLSRPFLHTSLDAIDRTLLLDKLEIGGEPLSSYILKDKDLRRDLQEVFVPTSPTEPNTIGYCWHDIVLADKSYNPPIVYVQGRGVAYGVDLLKQMFQLWSKKNVTNFRGIIRGHQHNNAAGDMLDRLIDSHGLVNLFSTKNDDDSKFQSEEEKNICPEKPDSTGKTTKTTDPSKDKSWLITTISAAESNLDMADYSFIQIITHSAWEDWEMNHFWTPVLKPKQTFVDYWNVCDYS